MKITGERIKSLELPPARSDQYVDNNFFPDEPIDQIDKDLLNRTEFIDKMSKQIINFPSSEPFVFGLHGQWGEGKTSVLKLLKNKLEKEQNIIVNEFDPWYFSSQNAVIKAFYTNLYISLNKKFFLPNFKATVTKYTKVLNLGVKASSGVFVDFTMSGESVEELKSQVEKCINYTRMKIVILIDDIDRLNKDDILQVFKIVKLSAKFKNVVFVLSFDDNVVRSQFQDEIHTDPSYIEKIIQSPINLPPAEQIAIDKFLYYSYHREYLTEVNRLFKILEIDEQRINEFHDSFDYAYLKYIHRLFPTLRTAKRYLNGLYSTLPAVKTEVNLHDFFILELVRIFYPKVYNDIWQRPWFYISASWSLITQSTWPYMGNEEKRYEQIKGHIEKVLPPDDKILQQLLEALFPEIHNALIITKVSLDEGNSRKTQRITHPDVFPKYFLMRIPQGELSDERVKAVISEWNSYDNDMLNTKMIEEFEKLREEKKLPELLSRFRVYHQTIEPHTASTLIRFLSKNMKLLPEEFESGLIESELTSVKLLIVSLLNDQVQPNEIQSLLKEIVTDTSSLNLAGSLLLMVSEPGTYYTVQKNIDINVLYENFFKRMNEYFISGQRDIFEGKHTLYGQTVLLARWAKSDLEVNNYILSLIDTHHHYLGRFIAMYRPDVGNNEAFLQIFDADSIYKRATQYGSDGYSEEHEKRAIEAFMKLYKANRASL